MTKDDKDKINEKNDKAINNKMNQNKFVGQICKLHDISLIFYSLTM